MIEIFVKDNEIKVVDRTTQKTNTYMDAKLVVDKMIRIYAEKPTNFESVLVEQLPICKTRIRYY